MLVQPLGSMSGFCCRYFGHSLLMTTERKKRVEELSEMLGRMLELVRLLKTDPEPRQFVSLVHELSVLLDETEGRLRQLGG